MRVFTLCGLVALTAIVGSARAGIISTTGAAVVVAPPPSLLEGVLESNTAVRVFNERQNVVLVADLNADVTIPATVPSGGLDHLSPGLILAGTVVSSYYMHFDAVGQPDPTQAVPLSGSVTFGSDILGLIIFDDALSLTDASLGLAGTSYGTGRQLEILAGQAGTFANDQVTLSADRRMVSFNLRDAGSVDQIRVITAVPEPAALSLIAAASLLLDRKRR